MAAARQQTEDAAPEAGNADLLGSLISADTVVFAKGDKVKVKEGDLQGLWGYVHAVRDDNTVEMMPQLKELNEILPFPPSQLAKTFEVTFFHAVLWRGSVRCSQFFFGAQQIRQSATGYCHIVRKSHSCWDPD